MADQPATERTEQPTPRRLQKAREEGQVPQSQELGAAVTLLALLLTLAVMGPGLLRWCKLQVEGGIGIGASSLVPGAAGPLSSTQAFLDLVRRTTIDLMVVMFPILAVLTVAGILASAVVGGVTFTPSALRLRWNAVTPVNTIQNLRGNRSLGHLLVSILKLLFVGIIVWLYLNDKLEVLVTLRWASSAEIASAIASILLGLGL